jgi:hypothetical protein
MDLVVVFHPPQPSGRIQACKLGSPKRALLARGEHVQAIMGKYASEHQIILESGSTRVPSGTVHFGELLAIFFHRQGRHHHTGAGPTRLHRMPEHGGRPW